MNRIGTWGKFPVSELTFASKNYNGYWGVT